MEDPKSCLWYGSGGVRSYEEAAHETASAHADSVEHTCGRSTMGVSDLLGELVRLGIGR